MNTGNKILFMIILCLLMPLGAFAQNKDKIEGPVKDKLLEQFSWPNRLWHCRYYCIKYRLLDIRKVDGEDKYPREQSKHGRGRCKSVMESSGETEHYHTKGEGLRSRWNQHHCLASKY